MHMTLAQVNGYTRAARRREVHRMEDMAVALRAAQSDEKAWAMFVKEMSGG